MILMIYMWSRGWPGVEVHHDTISMMVKNLEEFITYDCIFETHQTEIFCGLLPFSVLTHWY